MDDSLPVRRFERFGNLFREAKRLFERDGTFLQALEKRVAGHELEDEKPDPVDFLESVDRSDVRMIERREKLCLTLEASQPIGSVGESFRKDFDGDIALELRVASAVDLPHPTCADGLNNLVEAELGTWFEWHRRMKDIRKSRIETHVARSSP